MTKGGNTAMIWKQGSPDQPIDGDDVQYVEILRGDTGHGV